MSTVERLDPSGVCSHCGRGPQHLTTLTVLERNIVRLIATGASNREVGSELCMAVSTLEAHLSRIFRKVGVRNRTELAAMAMP